jgi:homopolymeric O-antigen transport system permease protein
MTAERFSQSSVGRPKSPLASWLPPLDFVILRRDLISQLVRREIAGRYRGSHLGIFWSLINPLIMLTVYTLVFGVIFNGRFTHTGTESPFDYALGLFCGINLFNFFAEVMQRSPALILNNPNLVKKVVFPLEVLPVVAVLAALFHLAIATIPLVVGLFLVHGSIPWGVLLLIPIAVPLVLATLGASWFLSSVGVFVRDLQAAVGPALTILMFLSCIFYPMSAVPEALRSVIVLNPMADLVECARRAAMSNTIPDWKIAIGLLGSGLVAFGIGLLVFRVCRPAFADSI